MLFQRIYTQRVVSLAGLVTFQAWHMHVSDSLFSLSHLQKGSSETGETNLPTISSASHFQSIKNYQSMITDDQTRAFMSVAESGSCSHLHNVYPQNPTWRHTVTTDASRYKRTILHDTTISNCEMPLASSSVSLSRPQYPDQHTRNTLNGVPTNYPKSGHHDVWLIQQSWSSLNHMRYYGHTLVDIEVYSKHSRHYSER